LEAVRLLAVYWRGTGETTAMGWVVAEPCAVIAELAAGLADRDRLNPRLTRFT
jgi:hypothetical protein